MKFKYVGHGDTPPAKIKFMGEVDFIINGDYVEVEDKEIVNKLMDHRCFVSDVIDVEIAEEPKTLKKKLVKKKV